MTQPSFLPSFLPEAVIYHVFLDRFARGGQEEIAPLHAKTPLGGEAPGDVAPGHYLGGDLWGVIDKLDHIQEVGANALWLSPFQQGVSYHGYHITDLNKVDERFGGEEAFDALVAEAHRRGIKVIMDFVPNHVSKEHPWFIESQNPDSPYRDWFYWEKKPDGTDDYKKFLWFGELPKLNLDNPDCRRAVLDSMKHWIDRGVDGFRMDHVLGPSMDFWAACRQELKAKDPSTAMIAEAWFHGIGRGDLHTLHLPRKERYMRAQELKDRAKGRPGHSRLSDALGQMILDEPPQYYLPYFDGVLDFGAQSLISQRARGEITKEELDERLAARRSRLPDNCVSVPFLDNHDINRIDIEANGNTDRLVEAIQTLMSQPGAPVITPNVLTDTRQPARMSEALLTDNPEQKGWWGDLMSRAPIKWTRLNDHLGLVMKTAVEKRKMRPSPSHS